MRKAFIIVLVLFVSLLCYQLVIVYFTNTHKIDYSISKGDRLFSISERYKNAKDEGYYFLNLKYKDKSFVFDIDNVFNKRKKIIKDFSIYENGNTICVTPIYVKEVAHNHIYCHNGQKQVSYEALKNSLDMEKLKTMKGFKASLYTSNLKEPMDKDGVIYYVKNFKKDEYVAIYKYKYLETYNEVHVDKFTFSEKDIYNNKMGLFSGKYFLMPIYTDMTTIKGYHIVDISTNMRMFFYFDEPLSLNSYIQGVVDNKVYLIDKTNKFQYEINLNKKNYKIVGSQSEDARVYDGEKFTDTNIQALINEEVFFVKEGSKVFNRDYLAIYKDYNSYILQLSNGDFIKVYSEAPEEEVYLFNNPNAKAITVSNGSIYYAEDGKIYRYDEYGIKPLLKYNELKFNTSNMYGAYYK